MALVLRFGAGPVVPPLLLNSILAPAGPAVPAPPTPPAPTPQLPEGGGDQLMLGGNAPGAYSLLSNDNQGANALARQVLQRLQRVDFQQQTLLNHLNRVISEVQQGNYEAKQRHRELMARLDDLKFNQDKLRDQMDCIQKQNTKISDLQDTIYNQIRP
jgi:hypothetical protein